jgi:L-iditol 2-dehydrogenase
MLPETMSYNEAAMIEPMACAVAGQNMLGLKRNDTVLILGSGISGLCHIMLAKLKGLNVISTDISDYRLNMARNFGSDLSMHANTINSDKIRNFNNGRLVEKVILCAGSQSAVDNAFEYIDRKGQILFFSIPPNNIQLPSSDLWRNEISLFFSYGASTQDIDFTINLYNKGKIEFKKMITHEVELSNIHEGFKLVETANDSIKVVVNPDSV